MQRFELSGEIKTGDDAVVVAILHEWLGEVKFKERVANEEFTYEDTQTSIYVTNPVVDGTTRPLFLLDGLRQGNEDDVRAFMATLKEICASQNVDANLAYWEVNEDGDDIGEEVEL